MGPVLTALDIPMNPTTCNTPPTPTALDDYLCSNLNPTELPPIILDCHTKMDMTVYLPALTMTL